MIARTWKGSVRRADAEKYADYIRETGFGESTVTHHQVVDQL
jgi:hypothetical protein